MATWVNADGLKIDLGITEATSQNPAYVQAGEYKTYGATRETEYTIDLTKLAAFGTTSILEDKSFFGLGWVVERVQIETLVTPTGTGATLSIGTRKNVDRTTDISTTAWVNAATLASLGSAGTRQDLVLGSTGAGGYIGLANTFDALATATVGTANFTAGKVKVRVSWRPSVNI